jgi:hypothetical protein
MPLAGGGTADSPEPAVNRRGLAGACYDLKHNMLIYNKLNIVRNLSIKQVIHPICPHQPNGPLIIFVI